MAQAAVPASSTRIVGNLRIQTLSPTLVRVEAKGISGFEDRETFMVVNRSMNTGVPITGTKVVADGSTHLTTAHYTVVVPEQQDSSEEGEELGGEETRRHPTAGLEYVLPQPI